MNLKCPVCGFVQEEKTWRKEAHYDMTGRYRQIIPGIMENPSGERYAHCPECNSLIALSNLMPEEKA
jgi:DNA-directed RNA polymerase subunit RPC12/RpoP